MSLIIRKKKAPEKHLAEVSRTVAVVYHFAWETARQKYFFQILSQKNSEVMNLKNPDLDLIRSILLECGYFGLMIRFWIFAKKRQNPFSDFPTKTHPYLFCST